MSRWQQQEEEDVEEQEEPQHTQGEQAFSVRPAGPTNRHCPADLLPLHCPPWSVLVGWLASQPRPAAWF